MPTKRGSGASSRAICAAAPATWASCARSSACLQRGAVRNDLALPALLTLAGCVFFPEGNVVDGELQFRLLATTSTGCIPGREGSMAVTKLALTPLSVRERLHPVDQAID